MAPLSKRRRPNQIEEISFDNDARSEYLTGFHKRKLHRIKVAQQENAKKERELRIETRKNMREQRKQDLETHVETVNKLLRQANGEETEGESDDADSDMEEQDQAADKTIDPAREEEYIDEDRYTTVTIEPMRLSENEESEESEDDSKKEANVVTTATDESTKKKKRLWTKKKPDDARTAKKKKKFKYESPVERKMARTKAKTKNSAAAKARRGA